MTLGTTNTLSPRVLMEVLSGPSTLTSTDLERSLMAFEYNHQKGEKPKITLEFDNTSGKVFNMGVLLAGATLKIRFGYQNVLSRPFIATLRKVAALGLGSPGVSLTSPRPDVYGRVKFEAMAYNWEVYFKTDDHIYTGRNVTAATVATQIARKFGYRGNQVFVQEGSAMEGVPDSPIPYVSLGDSESAEQYMTMLAAQRGFEFWVTDKEFHFHTSDWGGQAVEEIAYFRGPDLLEFGIDGDFDLKTTAVEAKSFDPLKGKMVVYTLDGNGVPVGRTMSQLARTQALAKKTRNSISPIEKITTVTAAMVNSASKRIWARVDSKWKISMTLIGNCGIFKGTTMNLSNFGPFIDGRWIVIGVRHFVNTSEGFRTQLALGRIYKGKKGAVTPPLPVLGPNGEYIGRISSSAEPYESPGSRKKRLHKRSRKKKEKNIHLGRAAAPLHSGKVKTKVTSNQ